MFSKNEFILESEKIDAIYAYVQKRRWIDILEIAWKWSIRSCIILFLWYIYLHPTAIEEWQLEKKLSSFVGGIAGSVTKDIVNSGSMGNLMNSMAGIPQNTNSNTTSEENSSTSDTSSNQCIRMTSDGDLILPNGTVIKTKK